MTEYAGVVELADALDSKSSGLIIRAGSTPATGTKTKIRSRQRADFRFVLFIIHYSLFIIHYSIERIFVMNNEVASLMNNE